MISIIIPVYNCENYIKKCLNSVLNQTVPNKEIILIDDGSTDRSGLICREFEALYPNIIYYHQKNAGAAAARNKGIELSTQEYITFIDSDDFYVDNHALENCLRILDQNDADQVVFGVKIINGDTSWINVEEKATIGREEALNRVLRNSFPISVHCKVFRRNAINDIRFWAGKIAEDQLFSVDSLFNSNTIYILNEVYYGYNRRENSVTTSFEPRILDVIDIKEQIWDKIISAYPYAEKYRVEYLGVSIVGLMELANQTKNPDIQLKSEISELFYSYFWRILLGKNIKLKLKAKTILVALGISHHIKKWLKK